MPCICPYLKRLQSGKGRATREHAADDAAGSGDFLSLVLAHCLFEDAGQGIALALLCLKVAFRPVMQQATKPA